MVSIAQKKKMKSLNHKSLVRKDNNGGKFHNSQAAAKEYLKKGYVPIPIPLKKKGSISDDWQNFKPEKNNLSNIFPEKSNIGIVLGKPSNGLVDIDIDCEEAKRFIGYLPETEMIHGRKSNPDSHYWFKLTGDIPRTTQFRDLDGSMIVEFRSTGGQTLVPPSTHPEGEILGWVKYGDAAAASEEELRSACAKMASGVLLSRNWPEKGSRNETSLALAGMLLRNGWEDSDAEEFIKIVAQTAGDDEWKKRGKAVDSTRKKLDADEPTTGIPHLKELIGEKVVSKACGWLKISKNSQNEIDDEINYEVTKLNKKHAVVLTGGKICVLNEGIDPYLNRPEITLSSVEHFKHRYSNIKIITNSKSNGDRVYSKLGAVWMDHPKRRQYDRIVFSPDGAPQGSYNLFLGFPIKPQKGDCSLYWDHVCKVICSGNVELYTYLRKYMAHAIQKPEELPGIAIVLRGKQGTGKGVFVEIFGRLFDPHYLTVQNMNQVTGRFNAHLKDLILFHANEATWGGNKIEEGVLKGMITDPYTPIEFKGQDIINVRNFKRLIVSSNEDWPVPVAGDDRRYLILDIPDVHKEDQEWFGSITEQMDTGGTEALMHDLLDEDLCNFNVRKPPQSGFGFDIKLQSFQPVFQWLYDFLCSGETSYKGITCELTEKWELEMNKTQLHECYLLWCKKNSKPHPYTKPIFTRNLHKVLGKIPEAKKKSQYGGRGLFYKLPTLEEARLKFEKFTKSDESIWPEVEEELEDDDDESIEVDIPF